MHVSLQPIPSTVHQQMELLSAFQVLPVIQSMFAALAGFPGNETRRRSGSLSSALNHEFQGTQLHAAGADSPVGKHAWAVRHLTSISHALQGHFTFRSRHSRMHAARKRTYLRFALMATMLLSVSG